MRRHPTGPQWQPGAGGLCLHTVLLAPDDPHRMYAAISAAGAFRSDDGGKSWRPVNRGLKSEGFLPEPDAEVGHCVHRLAMHPARPDVLFMQKANEADLRERVRAGRRRSRLRLPLGTGGRSRLLRPARMPVAAILGPPEGPTVRPCAVVKAILRGNNCSPALRPGRRAILVQYGIWSVIEASTQLPIAAGASTARDTTKDHGVW